MNVLFVHNNFPAQFKNLAEGLASRPGFRVVAVGCETSRPLADVTLKKYRMRPFDVSETHPFARRFDVECRRAAEVMFVLAELRASGFKPDLIIGHCGWGETLPLRALYPEARIAIYCEFYYRAEGQDVHFDPESPEFGVDGLVSLHCKNASTLLSVVEADLCLSPTRWQKETFPDDFHHKIHVVHEGVDSERLRPDENAKFLLPNGAYVEQGQEIVTFIARNLEPMRGIHVFLRALPDLLAMRPQAQIVIVGGDGVSYGASPPEGATWKSIYWQEIEARVDAERVHFLNRLPYDEYVKLLQVSRAHVYLTFPFVLSWSMVEAMAVGCAVIGSDTGPVREVIEDGRNGLLTPFFDARLLAEKVAGVLAAPERYATMRAAARKTAIERFDRRYCLGEALAVLGVDAPR